MIKENDDLKKAISDVEKLITKNQKIIYETIDKTFTLNSYPLNKYNFKIPSTLGNVSIQNIPIIDMFKNINYAISNILKNNSLEEISKQIESLNINLDWNLNKELTIQQNIILNFQKIIQNIFKSTYISEILYFDILKNKENIRNIKNKKNFKNGQTLTLKYEKFISFLQSNKLNIFKYSLNSIDLINSNYFLTTYLLYASFVKKENMAIKGNFSQIVDYKTNYIKKLLKNIDPSLIKLYEGANQSIDSENSDKIRHFFVSYREIITTLLHKLAPDEEIKSWTNKKEYYYNRKPTRKARVAYIFRNSYNDSIKDFFNIDIEANLELIDTINKGTHKLEMFLQVTQIKYIKFKIDTLIISLIEAKYFKK